MSYSYVTNSISEKSVIIGNTSWLPENMPDAKPLAIISTL